METQENFTFFTCNNLKCTSTFCPYQPFSGSLKSIIWPWGIRGQNKGLYTFSNISWWVKKKGGGDKWVHLSQENFVTRHNLINLFHSVSDCFPWTVWHDKLGFRRSLLDVLLYLLSVPLGGWIWSQLRGTQAERMCTWVKNDEGERCQ